MHAAINLSIQNTAQGPCSRNARDRDTQVNFLKLSPAHAELPFFLYLNVFRRSPTYAGRLRSRRGERAQLGASWKVRAARGEQRA